MTNQDAAAEMMRRLAATPGDGADAAWAHDLAAHVEHQVDAILPEDEIRLEIARRMSLAEFVRASWHVLEPSTPLVWNWHIDALCAHTQALLDGWADAIATGGLPAVQNMAASVPPGTMKPVWEDEPVIERTRGRIPLKDVIVGDEVLTHRGRFRRVKAVHVQGIMPLLEITTHRGRLLRVEPSNPVLTARGWVEALSLIHISEPTRRLMASRMPSSA